MRNVVSWNLLAVEARCGMLEREEMWDERGEKQDTTAVEVENEIRRLIQKYAGGRIPILVDKEEPGNGLVNGELLRIYQRGFSGKNLIPLGILFAKNASPDVVDRWAKGSASYDLNQWAKSGWINVCGTIRNCPTGDEACENCDRFRAKQAAERRDAIAYMCVHGMVGFAMPIFVEDQVVAVILTGQRVPKEGTRWNKDFADSRGLFSLGDLSGGEVEAWQVTLGRFAETESEYGLRPGVLLDELRKDMERDIHVSVSPEDVEEIRATLHMAGHQLSNLVNATYTLEKSKAVAALRSLVARSVAQVRVKDIGDVSGTVSSVSKRLSRAAQKICQYFGVDYVIVLNVRDSGNPMFRVLLSSAPSRLPWEVGAWVDVGNEAPLPLLDSVKTLPPFGDSDLWPRRELPFFTWMALWLKGEEASQCVAARLDHSGLPPCVLLAGREGGLRVEDFRRQDREDFQSVVGDIGMVMNVLLFIDELHAAGEAQELFLEDVAHDIRNPVQNLLVKTERLKLGLAPDSELRRQVSKVGAQIRRIDRLSQRVWLLEQLRRKRLKIDDRAYIRVYQVIKEAVSMVRDVAEEKRIGIVVSRDIEGWRALRIDHTFFFHAMLNLVDNAVKYSHEDTEVRIDGKLLHPKCQVSVVNRGVEIKEQYRRRIYRRGFRTPEATMHVREGSGIGLCIVKAFADVYGGEIDFRCTRVPETDHFVTEFRLVMPGSDI